ncbi:ATP-binding protein [Roseateles cellulosilyticus]|uniref:histidine kinase n=1 Tax=Pelomonas cellulosilytica TaxID=2906762 RepID=A0ABS8Y0N2_9BURK|nr:ATP-binding protein [Pelomonas sp. P8]MCE4556461.1 ATP-binding protein [Pelomonas sp. P8]
MTITAPPPGTAQPRRYRPLSRRYASWMCGLTLALLLISGALETFFGYREALDRIETVQQAQAEGAAREIETYISVIESGLRDVAKLPWGRPGFGAPQRREEFYRLMQLTPAITDLQVVDRQGREQLAISKHAADRFDSAEPIAETALAQVSESEGVRYGSTFFRDDYLPSVRLSAFDGTGAVVATVDLRLLGDVVSRLAAGVGGQASIVDASGLLIAHPTPTHVLHRMDLSGSPAVRQALAVDRRDAVPVRGIASTDIEGRPVIVTAARVRPTGWIVLMEQPRSAALQPVWATVARTLLLMLVGGSIALVAGIAFARRMAAPIVELRSATGRIAGGDLNTMLTVHRHDEIEDLAQDFNQMASRLRDLYASLEAKVAERTAQLSDARDVLAARADELARLKDEAERANAAKTRFLAAASHDLRQPMHSISLLLGVLQSRLEQPDHLALADKIQSSVATMESLFGNLLDISKLDAGAVQAHIEDVDLGWLLHRLEQTWAPQAAEKGLRLRVRACDVVVKGDAALLERIAGNLVANAIRYTHRGGVLVGCRRDGDGQLTLEVWDTGPGIEPRYREAIFEEFFRIEAPGTGAEKGLGLGLSIVQRCAHMLGYGLRVDSRVGHGTVFRLTMPLAAGSAPSRRALPRLAPSAQALAGRFIVVVDDDATNAQALVDALQACHCHVVAAASCDSVLTELQAHLRVPDLIVTDYQLGQGRDGFEVISRLRQHYDDDIPALVVTANTDAALPSRAAQHGARLLHKPIGLQRLLEAMQVSITP